MKYDKKLVLEKLERLLVKARAKQEGVEAKNEALLKEWRETVGARVHAAAQEYSLKEDRWDSYQFNPPNPLDYSSTVNKLDHWIQRIKLMGGENISVAKSEYSLKNFIDAREEDQLEGDD